MLMQINSFGKDEMWCDASPIWARPQDGWIDLYHKDMLQVVGHRKEPLYAAKEDVTVDAAHGKGGGYRLNRKPSEYTLGEILRVTERDLAPVACLEHGAQPCEYAGDCKTLPVWDKLNLMINEYLDGVTLDSLAG